MATQIIVSERKNGKITKESWYEKFECNLIWAIVFVGGFLTGIMVSAFF